MDKNKIYCMDCFKFLEKIEDDSIDLAVIDPPYNLKMAKWDTFNSHDDFLKFTSQWIDKIIPKLKKTGSLYIFNTPFNSAYILQHLVNKKMRFKTGKVVSNKMIGTIIIKVDVSKPHPKYLKRVTVSKKYYVDVKDSSKFNL